MDINIVEKLGAVCAFRPKSIEVLKSVVDQIPDFKLDDFYTILRNAREEYEKEVSRVKSIGEKPSSAKIKGEIFQKSLYPWLESLNIETKAPRVKVVRSSEDKVKEIKETKTSRKSSVLLDVDLDESVIKNMYDGNFSSDDMSDSEEVKFEIS